MRFLGMKKALILVLISVLIYSCKKEEIATLQVFLTDSPVKLDAVFIDIQGIQFNSSQKETENGWNSLSLNKSGIYNILNYRNGKDTLLASLSVSPTKISQFRFILGPDNRVVQNNKSFTLAVEETINSGIMVESVKLEGGRTYQLWIDFDAGRSLIKKANEQFILQPRLRIFSKELSGSVNGNIEPPEGSNYILCIAGSDTLGTIPDKDGNFCIQGIPTGECSVNIVPSMGFLARSINNIEITAGSIASQGPIQMEQHE
jgi:hypothetical protein